MTAPSARRLVDLRDTALSVAEATDFCRDPGTGGLVTFVGAVRDHDAPHQLQHDAPQGSSRPGRPDQHGSDRPDQVVIGLGYSAHPSARVALDAVVDRVAALPGVRSVAAVHRVGELAVGDLAVVCCVGAAHRGEAFDACRQLIDDLKQSVPIWKHQRFADGTDEWVGLP